MLCSAAEITLMPDWTVVVQLFIFLVVATTLTFFVIRPTIRIIDRRRQFTSDAAAEAAKLMNEAEQLDIGRREALAMALGEAHAEYAKRATEAHGKADGAIAEARAKSAETLKGEAASIESMEALNEKELESCANGLATDIVARVSREE
ncbi:MAG: hypothetical protein WC690_09825 [bacterium]